MATNKLDIEDLKVLLEEEEEGEEDGDDIIHLLQSNPGVVTSHFNRN